MADIKSLVNAGNIVIAAGGGGIPVYRDSQGVLKGIEAVIDTEQVACMVARELDANVLLRIVDREDKFYRAGLVMDGSNVISLDKLDTILQQNRIENAIESGSVQSTLESASEFLHNGGEQVMITSLARLSGNLSSKRGLRIGSARSSIDLFSV
jgi:carbamate kinase